MEQLKKITDQQSSTDEEARRLAVAALLEYPFEKVSGNLFYAMGDDSWRVRKEAVEAILTFPRDCRLIAELTGLLGAHENAGLRNSAVEALSRIGTGAVPILSGYINDSDNDVRKFVVDILGNIGGPDTVQLLNKVLDDPDQNVRSAAVENLGKTGDAAAVPHLLECLSSPDMLLRFTVLEALVKIGKPVAVERLLPMATENFLKKAVYECLGITGNPEAVPVLLQGLGEKRPFREAAAVALIEIRKQLTAEQAEILIDAHLRELKNSFSVEGPAESLCSAEFPVKKALLEILIIMADERFASAVLRESADSRLRSRCSRFFGAMGKEGGAFLISAFPRVTEEERRFIAFECGELDVVECAEILLQGMRDDDPQLRAVSALSAGKSGQAILVDQIAALTDDPEPDVRDAAVTALSHLAQSARDVLQKLALPLSVSESPEKRRNAALLYAALEDTDKLSILIKDEDVTVREAAVGAMASTGARSCVGRLFTALADENADVRIVAARALGDFNGEDVLEQLLLALKDPDMWVRYEALKSLGKLRKESAFQPVADVVDTSEAPVVIAALETLMAINGERSAVIVGRALEHEDEEVVKAAIELLAGIGGNRLDPYVDRLLHHPHWDVRQTFIRIFAPLWGASALPVLQEALKAEEDELVKRQLVEIVERMQ